MKLENQDKNLPFDILVVDDTSANLKLLVELLKEQGYHVRPANNGELALRSTMASLPDLILLDVKMSPIDGYEVCRRLKGSKSTSDIPVIFISALNDEASRVKGFEVGGVDFISKPFQKEEILARVKTHLNIAKLQSELKEKNQQLKTEIIIRKEAEERFRTTIYSIGDGVITTNEKGRIQMLNLVAEQLTGWKQVEVQGKLLEEVFQIINENTLQPVEIPVRKVLREGAKVSLANHTLLISKDRKQIPIAHSATPIHNENGKTVGVVLVFRDQTDERRTEKALKESEERFQMLFDKAPLGYQSLNIEGQFIDVNQKWCETLGFEKEEVIGQWFGSFLSPEYQNRFRERFPLFKAQGHIHSEFEMIHKKGEKIFIAFDGKVGYDLKGDFKQTHCILQDITEKRKVELALSESENKFRSLFENATIGFSMTLPGGEMNLNPAFAKMLGYEPEELKKINWKEITHPDDIQESANVIALLHSGEKSQHRYEKRYLHKSGAIIWADVSTVLIRDENGDPLYFSTNIIDITQKKAVEEKLIRSERELKKAQGIAHVGSWYLNLATNEVEWTEELYKMYGFDPSLPPPPFTEHQKLFTTESWKMLSSSLARTTQTGIPYELELETIKDDGSNGWMWVRGETVQDKNGKTIGLWGAAQDISNRKINELLVQQKNEEILAQNEEFQKLNEELDQSNIELLRAKLKTEKSESRFRKLIENGNDMISLVDQSGIVMYSSPVAETILGNSNDTLIGNSFGDQIHPDDRETVFNLFTQFAQAGEHIHFPGIRALHADGNWRWVEGTATNLLNDPDVNAIVVNYRDVTERIYIEEKLKKSEEKFSKSFKNAPVLISISDIETGFYIDVNDEALGVSGFDRSEVIGHTATEIGWISKEQRALLVEELKTKGRITNLEMKFRAKNGHIIRGIVKGELINLYGRECLLTATVDITERKRAEENINKERNLLRTLIDNLPINVYVKDVEGRKLIANKSDIDFIGKTCEEEVIGKTDIELFTGENGQHGYEEDMEIMKTGIPLLNFEECFYDNRNNKRWLVTSKIPLRDENGNVYGLVGTGRDETRKHRDHETIQKLSKSIEQSPSSIVITNLNGDIEYVNPKFCEITGYEADEASGKNPRILKSGDMPAEKYVELWDTISSGGVWRGEFHNRKKDGELYWEWATITSIKDDRGNIINYIAIKEDISLRKQMEIDLIAAKEKAEESDRLKTAFLANMSHEIRTPLNSILGFTDLLCETDLEAADKEVYSKLIFTSGNNLLAVINDILDISKIEAGQIQFNKNKFKVQTIFTELIYEFENKITQKGLSLRIAPIVFQQEITIESDESRIKQVLINFITNALKFTNTGFIEIGFSIGESSLQFYVKDSGIGIPFEYHHNIFERFRQVETSHTRKYGGNGLGLAISKSLVQMLGGEIGMESEPGKGSTFYFKLFI